MKTNQQPALSAIMRHGRYLTVVVTSVVLLGSAAVVQGGETERASVNSLGIQGNGSSITPTLSANGKVVAFSSSADNLAVGDTNGDPDIFVHDLKTGKTVRVSVDSAGMDADDDSIRPVLSANGKVVAFESEGDSPLAGDTNGESDIYVHDLRTGKAKLVSVDSAGLQSNSDSSTPALSANGKVVAFESDATNLVAGDTNLRRDIFVHDLTTGKTKRVSVNSVGTQADRSSFSPALSANGKVVTFESDATNLVAGDTNNAPDIFVHDLRTGKTERVSVDSVGLQGNGSSGNPALSANGKMVAFHSAASNLVGGDSNGTFDIFVHDRETGVTERVSVDSAGTQSNGGSFNPALSTNGQVVAFQSAAANLVAGDTNGRSDIFVHDRKLGTRVRVSVDSNGMQGNGHSAVPALSANGKVIAFRSVADNLVTGDSNGFMDIFVHDRKTGETERVSVHSAGTQSNGESFSPVLSANGQVVAFESRADNLVAGDTNGTADIFVHDRKTGLTERVSVDSLGTQSNGRSFSSVLSASGTVIAFESEATNLVAGDTNGRTDIFVHDLTTGETERVSVDSLGRQSNGSSFDPVLSASGKVIAFESLADNLVAGDTNGFNDIFVHDRR